MDEYERLEVELSAQYAMYVQAWRNMSYLEHELDELHAREVRRRAALPAGTLHALCPAPYAPRALRPARMRDREIVLSPYASTGGAHAGERS